MASGPTARTLEMLHKEGYIAQVVERWNPWAQRKIDLFNCIDIIAVRPTRCSIVGIQCTTGSHHAVRRAKILSEPKARAWLECGGSIEIRSWSRRGGRGKRKKWEERVEEITLEMFDGYEDVCAGREEGAQDG